MIKNINKKGVLKFATCSLLAVGLLLGTGVSQLSASTGGVASSATLSSNPQELLSHIKNMPSPVSEETEGITINERTLKLDIGSSAQLQLTDKNGAKVNGVEWFCVIKNPDDVLYTAKEYNDIVGVCTISPDGLVTAKSKGSIVVWAKFGKALYKCDIVVEDEKITKLNNVVEKIADKFRHLNDVDKVMAVQDYLLDHITYSNEHIVSYAYGALVEGKAVCQGYSQAFQKIMSALNIEGSTVGGYLGDDTHKEKHAWNKVKLDDGWYFIDTTVDDNENNLPIKNYTNFLINSTMLANSRHREWVKFPSEVDGSKYLNYAYKKKGLFAENDSELENVLRSQFNSSNSSSMYLGAMVPNSMGESSIKNKITTITGGSPTINEVTALRNTIGDYSFYYYDVSNIPTVTTEAATLTEVRSGNGTGETTSKLILTFDKDINGLSIEDIKIENARKIELKKVENKIGVYELSIADIILPQDNQLSISVGKRGYNISNDTQKVPITIVKEPTPQVAFNALDNEYAELTGVEVGMQYTVGDGIWNEINSADPLKIKIKFATPVYVVRKSTGIAKMDSDYQVISPKYQREPLNIKAVDTIGNANNGKLLYVNSQMEYQKDGEQNWTECTDKEVNNLTAGKYYVRYKAKGLKMASDKIEVMVNTSNTENNSTKPNKTEPNAGTTGSNNGSLGGNNSNTGSTGSGNNGNSTKPNKPSNGNAGSVSGTIGSSSSSGGNGSPVGSGSSTSSSNSTVGNGLGAGTVGAISGNNNPNSPNTENSHPSKRKLNVVPDENKVDKTENNKPTKSDNITLKKAVKSKIIEKIKPKISGNKAKLEIKKDVIAKIIKKAEKDKISVNNIDLTLKAITKGKLNELEVKLSKASIDTIINSDISKLTIKGNKVSVSFNEKALSELHKSAKSGVEMKLLKLNGRNFEKQYDTDVLSKLKKAVASQSIYKIIIRDRSGNEIKKIGSLRVSLKYKLKKGEKAKNIKLYNIKNNGKLKKISKFTYNRKNNKLSFDVKGTLSFVVY